MDKKPRKQRILVHVASGGATYIRGMLGALRFRLNGVLRAYEPTSEHGLERDKTSDNDVFARLRAT
jgi:hypothetical protein